MSARAILGAGRGLVRGLRLERARQGLPWEARAEAASGGPDIRAAGCTGHLPAAPAICRLHRPSAGAQPVRNTLPLVVAVDSENLDGRGGGRQQTRGAFLTLPIRAAAAILLTATPTPIAGVPGLMGSAGEVDLTKGF